MVATRPRLSTSENEEFYQMAMGYVTQSSAHGLPKVARSDTCKGRIFWSSILIAALVMFCLQCFYLISRYFSYPKSVRLEVINQPVPFPAVSICNLRPLDLYTFVDTLFDDYTGELRWRAGVDFNYTGRANSPWPHFERSLIQFGHSYSSYYMFAGVMKEALAENSSSYPGLDLSAENDLYSRMTLAANFDYLAYGEGSTQKEQFIGKCEYAGEPCTAANFTRFTDPAFFSCFTFDLSATPQHSGDSGNTIYEGPDHGLSLLLFVPSIGSFGNLSDTALDSLAIGQDVSLGGEGIRVVIHEQNTVPYPLTDGLDVPRGVSASIGINMAKNVRLGPPHGNCTTRQTLQGSLGGYTYTMAACKKFCLQRLIVETCGCADISLPLPAQQNVTFCATFDAVPQVCQTTEAINAHRNICKATMVNWFNRMACMKALKSNTSKNLSAWAICDCQPRCQNDDYKSFPSLSDWPMAEQSMNILSDVLWTEGFLSTFPAVKAQKYFGPLTSPNVTFAEYDAQIKTKNFARVNAFISDTSVVKIEEVEDYGFTQLVSDVGGQLGLWIGVSIISVFELFELIFHLSIFAVSRLFIPNRIREFDPTEANNNRSTVERAVTPCPPAPTTDDIMPFDDGSPLRIKMLRRPDLPTTIYTD